MCTNFNFPKLLAIACGGIVEPRKTMYSVDYFLNFFSSIPEEKWMTGNWHNQDKTKFCALGHLGGSAEKGHTRQAEDLSFIMGCSVAEINDGNNDFYQQIHPKDRIIAALMDAKNYGKAKFDSKPVAPVIHNFYPEFAPSKNYFNEMYSVKMDWGKIDFDILKEEPKVKEVVKEVIKEVIVEKIVEKTVYVTVDKEVRELQEETLIEN